MPVNLHGKEYSTVAERIPMFWAAHPNWSIVTTEIVNNEKRVVYRAAIADQTNRVRATGTAEEMRDSGGVNKTSALENCETSAVGRALAMLGYGGDSIASADEVARAIQQQGDAPAAKPQQQRQQSTQRSGKAVYMPKMKWLGEDAGKNIADVSSEVLIRFVDWKSEKGFTGEYADKNREQVEAMRAMVNGREGASSGSDSNGDPDGPPPHGDDDDHF